MFALVRALTSPDRTKAANERLGATLAFIAGAANAGGFLYVGQYTSHMTGIVSSMADNLVLGQISLMLGGLSALIMFLAGAMTTAIIVNWARLRRLHSLFSLPLLLEASLLLLFGLMGSRINEHLPLLLPATVLLLCYMMGLQNAVITKISRAEIRTTHVTGLVTDLGIELGKLFYINHFNPDAPVLASRGRLRLQALLIGMFFGGGVTGALGFKLIGHYATLPLAAILLLLCARSLLDDIREYLATGRVGQPPQA